MDAWVVFVILGAREGAFNRKEAFLINVIFRILALLDVEQDAMGKILLIKQET